MCQPRHKAQWVREAEARVLNTKRHHLAHSVPQLARVKITSMAVAQHAQATTPALAPDLRQPMDVSGAHNHLLKPEPRCNTRSPHVRLSW